MPRKQYAPRLEMANTGLNSTGYIVISTNGAAMADIANSPTKVDMRAIAKVSIRYIIDLGIFLHSERSKGMLVRSSG